MAFTIKNESAVIVAIRSIRHHDAAIATAINAIRAELPKGQLSRDDVRPALLPLVATAYGCDYNESKSGKPMLDSSHPEYEATNKALQRLCDVLCAGKGNAATQTKKGVRLNDAEKKLAAALAALDEKRASAIYAASKVLRKA